MNTDLGVIIYSDEPHSHGLFEQPWVQTQISSPVGKDLVYGALPILVVYAKNVTAAEVKFSSMRRGSEIHLPAVAERSVMRKHRSSFTPYSGPQGGTDHVCSSTTCVGDFMVQAHLQQDPHQHVLQEGLQKHQSWFVQVPHNCHV